MEVLLSVPLDATQQEVDYILMKRKKWITQKLDFFKAKQKSKKLLISGEDFFYLGRRYRLKIIRSTQTKIFLKNGYLQIHLKDTENYRAKKLLIQKWYQDQAKNVFTEILLRYCKILGVEFKTFSIRTMKTRWGSCKIDKLHITLNLELIKKSKQAIEYVILHELAHLKFPYHNKDFCNYLDLYMPRWRTIKNELNSE